MNIVIKQKPTPPSGRFWLKTGQEGRWAARTTQGRRSRWSGPLVALSFAALWAIPGVAQEPQVAEPPADQRVLSLEEVIAEALDVNPDLVRARYETAAMNQGVRAARSGMLPTLGLEGGAMWTDDPVAVFGARLRQGVFGQDDFQVDRLNSPDRFTDYSLGIGAEWRALDPSLWKQVETAELGSQARHHFLLRQEEFTRFYAEVLYLTLVGQEALVDAAEAARDAATASTSLISRRVEEGAATDAERLAAEAELASAIGRVAQAEEARLRAGTELALFLGRDPSQSLRTQGVPGSAPARSESGAETRVDLLGHDLAVASATAAESAVSRSRLPSLTAFGRFGLNRGESWNGSGDHWTFGARLSVPLFTGFRVEANQRIASETRRAKEVERDAAYRKAEAEAVEAEAAARSAALRLEAADAGLSAAEESRRLTMLRYREGLATAVQLLEADSRLAEMKRLAVGARVSSLIAHAQVRFAQGSDASSLDQVVPR